jgi:RHS repeat-associated protein
VCKVSDKLQSTDQVQGFSHDSLNRLTSAYAEGGSGGTYASSSSPQLYTYDSQGRLDEKAGVSLAYAATPTGTCHTTSTYPNRNATIPHAVSSADTYDFTYDCSGNMVTRESILGTQTLVYDAENHLVEVIIGSTTLAEFTYDGDGARVMTIIYDGNDTITTRYYGNYLEYIETYSGGVTVSNSIKYYYTGATRIAMRTNDSPVQYLLSDHLGSTSLVVSTSGTIVAQNRYMPWGEVRYSSGTMPTDYTYTGQKNAPEIGLMFYNARWYDPAIAHFTQADSLIPGAGSPQAWDRYAYVLNNPLIYTDPSGHAGCLDGEYCASEKKGVTSNQIIIDILTHDFYFEFDGAWEVNTLLTIWKGTSDLANVMGDSSVFNRCIGNISLEMIFKDNKNPAWLDGRTVFVNSKLKLTEWTIIHELAHAWDSNYEWALSQDMKKEMGGRYPYSELLHELFPDQPAFWYKTDVLPYPAGTDKNFNPKEDFAESVTASVYPDEAMGRAASRSSPYPIEYTSFRHTPRYEYILNLIKGSQ